MLEEADSLFLPALSVTYNHGDTGANPWCEHNDGEADDSPSCAQLYGAGDSQADGRGPVRGLED